MKVISENHCNKEKLQDKLGSSVGISVWLGFGKEKEYSKLG